MLQRETFVPTPRNGSTTIRVLMADPDSSLAPVYRESLLQAGIELETATNGLECVARLREQAPDALVLEPHMPWGGGDGILAIMGELPQLANVPVMVLTSCRDPHVLNHVSRFPISDYQLKPIAPDRLADRLRSLLDHPRLRFTLAEQTGRLECEIARRTGDRIRDLHVAMVDGRVVVSGRSDSEDVRQQALAAVMEAFEASESQSDKIELNIEVS